MKKAPMLYANGKRRFGMRDCVAYAAGDLGCNMILAIRRLRSRKYAPMVILPFIIYNADNNLIGERVFIAALIMGALGFICFQFMIRNTETRVEDEIVLREAKPKLDGFLGYDRKLHRSPLDKYDWYGEYFLHQGRASQDEQEAQPHQEAQEKELIFTETTVSYNK